MSLQMGTACAVLVAVLNAQAPALPPASADVQQLVRDALGDRLAARDIPEFQQQLRDGRMTQLAVRAEMPAAHAMLTAEAMPTVPGVTLQLLPMAELRADAARRHADVWFVTVDEPSIDGDRAALSIGADVVLAQRDAVKLCCCESRAEFARRDTRWMFVRWTRTRCS